MGENVESNVDLDQPEGSTPPQQQIVSSEMSDEDIDEDDNLNRESSFGSQDYFAGGPIDSEEALLKKLGMNPNEARPTGAQVHKALKYFDLAVKLEYTLHEMQQGLFNNSSLEILFFLIGMAFYFRTMEKMANFWMFIPHLFRGFVGLRIYFKMPRSHEVVKSLGFDTDTESNLNLSFEEM